MIFYIFGFLLTWIFLGVTQGRVTQGQVTENTCIAISWPFFVLGLFWVHRMEISQILGDYLGFTFDVESLKDLEIPEKSYNAYDEFPNREG